ncbi:MAG TPA: hypothetical protein DEB25_07800 [Desulfobulbaceae bacterium]|nr:hypothetical protein [Desulfobulbaceae bacterium]
MREEVEKITDIVFPEAKQIRAMALEAAADEDDDFADDIEQETLRGDSDISEEDYVGDDDGNDLEDDSDKNE